MSDKNKTDIERELKKAKILEQKQKFVREKAEISWNAVAKPDKVSLANQPQIDIPPSWMPKTIRANIDFHGKNLRNGNFAGENLENANFANADLRGINLAGANLRGVDFTGADLTGANLEGADLTGANLSGAKLVGTNLKKSKLRETQLKGADLTDAIFLEIDIDNLTLEDIQELVEYLATYYPHKLNLAKFDLKLLDLSRIDLTNVNLRGVDFTGVDFTGVNILELDLSECIITPEQIAQALGRTPSPEELKKILAPKPKKKHKSFFIDMTDFFFDNGIPAGVWDTMRGKAVSFEQIFGAVKRFGNAFKKDEKAPVKAKENTHQQEQTSSNDDLRRAIEENKKNMIEEKLNTPAPLLKPEKEKNAENKPKPQLDKMILRQHGDNTRGM